MIFIASDATTYATATSYLSIARADVLISASSSAASWTGKTDAIKQIFLNQSSIIVDEMASYQNSRTDKTQFLKFPRGGSKTIPIGVQYATAAIAVKLADGEAFGSGNAGQIQSEKANGFSTSYFPASADASARKDHAEAQAFVSRHVIKQIKIGL
ncbi:MAG: hypothetical protein H0A75_00195 [Candidatus Methanofishera endochildressiae]|uniref:Putative DnaT-like domain-containing protein n=1 Tax=Candidatus Methanofishera endochildressiae TaxID=2738884 RepID=A0A7Z0MMM9_9GAMM|nr:hypothetical protein [Candidatus Methanofishera endochildressiae]